jgi:hypothetical protein
MNSRRLMWGSGGIFLMAMMISVLPARARTPQDDAQVVKDFGARISSYMDLHKKEAGDAKPTDSPEKLAQQRKEIAAKMQAARTDAHQGDIFTPPIAGYFRRQIAATLAGHDGAKIRASLQHAEPLKGVSIKVNSRYPQGVALQSTPPTLLLNLPRLPHELQYRIVDRDLVLYDAAADIVVDYVPNAVVGQ